jgi:hypothetical protein
VNAWERLAVGHSGGRTNHWRTGKPAFFVLLPGKNEPRIGHNQREVRRMSILWIILIVVLVLALLGLFSRGYW